MASTYKGLAGLARDTADACAAAAVMMGDAQQHTETLKEHLDKLKMKAGGDLCHTLLKSCPSRIPKLISQPRP